MTISSIIIGRSDILGGGNWGKLEVVVEQAYSKLRLCTGSSETGEGLS